MRDPTEETALAPIENSNLAEISAQAEIFSRATALTRYQEGLRDETIRRQKTDLETFARFLASAGKQSGDFYNDLSAWSGVSAGLLVAFIEWQKQAGYAIGTINIRLATVKAYCHLAFSTGHLDTDTHIHIQGVKGIPRRQARNIDSRRETRRVGHKKAEPVEIPLEKLYDLKHPDTGNLAKRDALLMCLLLDHGLRVGEIAVLKRNQIALRAKLLTFYRPKVDIPQTDRLTPDTLSAARAYMATLPANQESLFNLAIISIQERVRRLGELVGIEGLSPHDCRHSWATRAAAHGTPLDRLKQAGGWSNLQTPLRYIRNSAIANEGVILE
ncbi:MAG TPA: tyrosine-type recombinase/integrase [Ktedonobacteraceae bacterium]|nr:tyrosine-type recombinase/integrase [Ktedonobacteraceae bacterium]